MAETLTDTVCLTLLGPFSMTVQGDRVHLGGRKTERLFAALLLQEGRQVPVSRLVEAVWDVDPPATAEHQVRKMIGALRHCIPTGCGVRIHTDGTGYRVELPPGVLDLGRFERALAAAQVDPSCAAVAQLRDLLRNWSGPAVAGMDTGLLRSAARLLEDRRIAALCLVSDLDLAGGRESTAAELLTPAVAELPLAESLRSRLMLALYRTGQTAEAIRVFEEGRILLRDELGLDPGPDLVSMHQRILRTDPRLQAESRSIPRQRPVDASATAVDPVGPVSPVGPVVESETRSGPADGTGAGPAEEPAQESAVITSTLPYDLPDFTGRAAELTAVRMLLPAAESPALTIISVQGMPGVGKTAFAVHAAHELRERFPDGQFFLDLHGLTKGREPLSPADALDRLLRWTGLPGSAIPAGWEERAALWRHRTAGLAFILVLDNVIDSLQAGPLIPGSDRSLVLLTSRMALHGIDGAVPIPLAPPPEAEAVRLLSIILGSDRVAAEPVAALELVRRCGLLPLAIRVAAARLQSRPNWTVQEMVDRLNRDRPTRELTVGGRRVEAAIELSYLGVDEDQRRMFRLLAAVPADSITPYLAAAVAGTDRAAAEEQLEELLDTRLLESRQPGRYHLHDLMRSFALGRLDPDGGAALPGIRHPDPEVAAAVRGYHDALLAAVKAAAAALDPDRRPLADELRLAVMPPVLPDSQSAFGWLDAEYDNLIAAARSAAAAGLPRHVVHYARDLWSYLFARGRHVELAELLQLAVAAARELGDPQLELQAMTNAFVPLWRIGEVEAARHCAEQALQAARRTGQRRIEGTCLGNVALVLAGQGKLAESLDYCERALAVHRETGNHRQLQAVLTQQVLVLSRLNRFEQAQQAAAAAVAAVQDHPNPAIRLMPEVNLAIVRGACGDPTAVQALERLLAEATRRSIPYVTGDAALALAGLWSTRDPVVARRYAVQARTVLATAGDPAEYAEACSMLGGIELALGQPGSALREFQTARSAAERMRDRAQSVRALVGQARALAATGEPGAAAIRREAERAAAELDPAEAGVLLADLDSGRSSA